jgi:hypothetical protein
MNTRTALAVLLLPLAASAQAGGWYEIQASQLEQAKKGPSLIEFYMDGCGPCARAAATIERIHDEYPGITFYHFNGPRNGQGGSFPQIYLYDASGALVSSWTGFPGEEHLRRELARIPAAPAKKETAAVEAGGDAAAEALARAGARADRGAPIFRALSREGHLEAGRFEVSASPVPLPGRTGPVIVMNAGGDRYLYSPGDGQLPEAAYRVRGGRVTAMTLTGYDASGRALYADGASWDASAQAKTEPAGIEPPKKTELAETKIEEETHRVTIGGEDFDQECEGGVCRLVPAGSAEKELVKVSPANERPAPKQPPTPSVWRDPVTGESGEIAEAPRAYDARAKRTAERTTRPDLREFMGVNARGEAVRFAGRDTKGADVWVKEAARVLYLDASGRLRDAQGRAAGTFAAERPAYGRVFYDASGVITRPDGSRLMYFGTGDAQPYGQPEAPSERLLIVRTDA